MEGKSERRRKGGREGRGEEGTLFSCGVEPLSIHPQQGCMSPASDLPGHSPLAPSSLHLRMRDSELSFLSAVGNGRSPGKGGCCRSSR